MDGEEATSPLPKIKLARGLMAALLRGASLNVVLLQYNPTGQSAPTEEGLSPRPEGNGADMTKTLKAEVRPSLACKMDFYAVLAAVRKG